MVVVKRMAVSMVTEFLLAVMMVAMKGGGLVTSGGCSYGATLDSNRVSRFLVVPVAQ